MARGTGSCLGRLFGSHLLELIPDEQQTPVLCRPCNVATAVLGRLLGNIAARLWLTVQPASCCHLPVMSRLVRPSAAGSPVRVLGRLYETCYQEDAVPVP